MGPEPENHHTGATAGPHPVQLVCHQGSSKSKLDGADFLILYANLGLHVTPAGLGDRYIHCGA